MQPPEPSWGRAKQESLAARAGVEVRGDKLHQSPALDPSLDEPDTLRHDVPATTLKLDHADVSDNILATRISHFDLLGRVGEGGCGVGCVAAQTEPFRRRVALKVDKLGIDSRLQTPILNPL
jgi:hypothetical protein